MKKLVTALTLMVLICSLFMLMTAQKADAKTTIKPEIKWSLSSKNMKKMLLEPRDIVAVRLSGDCSRLFILEHGYHLPSRLMIFDAGSGKQIGGANIKVRDVSNFTPNNDGTKVFLVTDLGSGAMELDVTTGKTRKVWEKKKNQGFRFMVPIGVYTGPNNKYWARGYFLDSSGKTAGDYIVSFDTSKSGPAKIEKKINITALHKKVGGKGRVTNIATNLKRDIVGFVVTTGMAEATLYATKVGSSEPPTKIAKGMRIMDITMDDSGKHIFYSLDDGKNTRLLIADTKTGKKFMISSGSYISPMTTPDGDRVLVSTLPMGGDGQTFYIADGRKGWKVFPLDIPGFEKGDKLGIYYLGRDGRTFFIWSKDAIMVGELP